GPIEHRLEQQLRIVEYLALDADAREQTHGLDVVTVLEQEGADELLGLREFAVREQCCRRHHLGRQFFQRRDMRGRLRGVCRLARHPVQALEHAPADRQGRIHVHAAQKGVDCLGCLLQHDVAMTTFLVQAAEARMQLLESVEGGERRRDVAQQTLRLRAQIQEVAILGDRHQQTVSRAQAFREPPLAYELAYPPNLEFHRRGMVHERTISPHSSVWPSSEFVAQRGPQDPWPQRRLRDYELIGTDEHAGVRIAQVFAVHAYPPGILR